MTSLGELRVDATLENLRTISYFIHGVGRRLNLTDKCLFDVELAVEEAAANIVKHAYPPGAAGQLLLTLERAGDDLRITLTDWGIPFNPEHTRPFDINAPIETRIQGGMGLYFISSLTDGITRTLGSSPGDPNSITMVKRIDQMRPGAQHPSALRELNAMLGVSRFMVANVELDDLLVYIVNVLVELIGAERGTLYLIDPQKGELVSRVLLESTGTLGEIRVKIGEGIAGYVAQTGKIVNIKNAYEDERFIPAFDQITGYKSRTILAAPLRNHQQEIIGVVQLLNKSDGVFTSRDERLALAMAAQAAVSIENARLYAQEIQQRLIQRDLETARAIQKSFLPQALPLMPGWEIAAFWSPVHEVGGDFYDLYRLNDGRMAVIIGDVSGKGVPAAIIMACIVSIMRFAMSLHLEPDRMMAHSNEIIIADQHSKMFATVFAGYVDLISGQIQFACAGHNPPILYRARSQQCEYLEALGVAIGIFKNAEFEQNSAHLESGDVLVLYTDGISEAINAVQEEFGETRLIELIVQYADKKPQALAELIIEHVTDFCGDQGSFDDESLIIIKRL